MACRNLRKTESSGLACRCKPPRCRPHQGRLRASGDVNSSIKIYSRKPVRKVGFVYIFASEAGPIKIGFSKCPVRRLGAMSTFYGLVWLARAAGMRIATARKLERTMHSRLFKWAGDLNEWYEAPLEIASAILDEELSKIFPKTDWQEVQHIVVAAHVRVAT